MTATPHSKRLFRLAVTTLVVLGAFSGSASSRAAGVQLHSRWTFTVTQAEAWTVRHVTYFDRKAANEFLEEWDYRHADVEKWCTLAATGDQNAVDQCASLKPQFRTWAGPWGIVKRPTPKQVGTIKATGALCRSDSPSLDSYHFWRFRCRVQFNTGYGIARLTVTGPRSAVWRWL